ncbi:MAG: type ISP restriction/modification enzyme [Allosphingosinicella sp.]
MSLDEAVARFGAAAKAKLSNPGATGEPEDQLRAPLEGLFADMSALCGDPVGAVTLVGETSLADLKTRPDYAVTLNMALIGHIEVKAPGKGADPRRFREAHDKEQWEKLKALPNLLYTDGNTFSLWRDGKPEGSIVRLSGEVAFSGKDLEAPPTLLPLIASFLGWKPVAPRSARELAGVSARLSRFLRDEVVEQMARGSKPLTELAKDWRTLLFPHATDEQFADGYAQAVTFGLLMAKSLGLSLNGGLEEVARKLGKTNTLIGTALRLLTEQAAGQAVLVTSLDTMVRVLDVVDWAKVAKGDPEAWLYFYEDFLAVYDKTLRRQTGSYYTPPEVVQTMVRLSDEALRDPARFGIASGLASPDVTIADPAMGSGTFLLGVLRKIAAHIEADEGAGAVGEAISAAVERLIGFELQFGAFAVAQLRLLAELIDLGASGEPRLFVTDTLGDPYEKEERIPGVLKVLSESRAAANKIKAAQPITLVIGNPPYKDRAGGRGGWVEKGSANQPAILGDWLPPAEWGVGAHSRHLYNLYVFFWRWAAWKVFEQGAGSTEHKPTGIVCFITAAGFIAGEGFQKMRAELRRSCDEIWVIDCSPEGHQPPVPTRIFEGVQHPVTIVLASRSPKNGPRNPAKVRFRALSKGKRKLKFEDLAGIALDSSGWQDCSSDWRAPFLPSVSDRWEEYPPLEALIGETGTGVMAGRTWIVAPDKVSLQRRWDLLVREPSAEWRSVLFFPHLRKGKPGDRHIAKASKELAGSHGPLESVERQIGMGSACLTPPLRYGFRSFDRQWIIPDNRLINQPNPGLWRAEGGRQIHLTAPMDRHPTSGPACSFTSLIPDVHHYAGRGGRVFALWLDAAATKPNVPDGLLGRLRRLYGSAASAEDLMAYVAAVAAHPAYTTRFQADLIRPGLRIPLTAEAKLFEEAVELGREVIWLHTFGERFTDPANERGAGPPRMKDGPTIPKEGAIPSDPAHMPDEIDYDASARRLHVGAGFVDNVPPGAWGYEVSGKQVLRQWFSYRKRDRERPIIGDRRKPSPLGDIQPDHWLPEYTTELLNVLHVLGRLVDLEPKQAELLDRICNGPIIPAAKL